MANSSMEPTINQGDNISIEPRETLKRQDIVAFNYTHPSLAKQNWVFRIVGVPGDTIQIKQGELFINGKVSDEPYKKLSGKVTDPATYQPEIMGATRENGWNADSYGPVVVPLKGEIRSNNLNQKLLDNTGKILHDLYFVLGDNRHDAYDSRFIGFIPKTEIVGVVNR